MKTTIHLGRYVLPALLVISAIACRKAAKVESNDAAEKCRNATDPRDKLPNCLAACSSGEKWACEMADTLKAQSAPKESEAGRICKTYQHNEGGVKFSSCLAACSEGLKWACEVAETLRPKTVASASASAPASSGPALPAAEAVPEKWKAFAEKLAGMWKISATAKPGNEQDATEAASCRMKLTVTTTEKLAGHLEWVSKNLSCGSCGIDEADFVITDYAGDEASWRFIIPGPMGWNAVAQRFTRSASGFSMNPTQTFARFTKCSFTKME